MKRVVVLLMVFALVLAGCGGASGDTTVPDPPNASAFQAGSNTQINTIVEQWQAQVPQKLVSEGVKQESIEQKLYQSTATLQEVADYYKSTLPGNGWIEVQRMPGVQDGFFSTAYDHGTTHLVIGAVDGSKFESQGVVIYTVKGTK